MPGPLAVTALVVTYRGADFIDECLDSLVAAAGVDRILVVDNGSTDGTAERLAARPGLEVIRLAGNAGLAGGVAAGLGSVRTPFVALVNDDARVAPDAISLLVAACADDGVAAATAKLVLDDGRINNAGSALLPDGYGYDRGLGDPDDGRWDEPEDVEAFCGGGAVLRVDVLREVGGFPAPFFCYYEDTDVSLRLRAAGWRIRYVPAAVVHHRHSATSDQASAQFHLWNERNRLLMLTRNFPPAVARHEVWRFTRSIAGFTRRRLQGVAPANAAQRPSLRLRVLLSYLRLLPWALRTRPGRQRATAA